MILEEMTVADAKASRDAAQAEVNRLSDRQSDLIVQIQECADQARLGKVMGDLNALATEKAATDRELDDAELSLELAAGRLATTTAEADRKRFNLVVAETKMRRAEFSELLRAGCLLLGKIVSLKGEAGQLAQSQVRTVGPSTGPIVYKDPFIQSALEEVNRPLPAAADFTVGAGPDVLVPDVHLGWRTEVKICPLNSKGEKQNGRP